MNPEPPVLDALTDAERYADLRACAPGYTPDWRPRSGSADDALARIFARYAGLFAVGLRETPRRGFLAFLDLLGARLLAAQAAHAPLVFTLMENATTDPLLPANSQVAAPAVPRAPSPLLGADAASKPEPAVFATTKEITLARAALATFYSIDPSQDAFADHTTRLTTGFTLFDDLQPIEHALYLGHDRLFEFAANPDVAAEVRLSVRLAPGGGSARPLRIEWQYLSEEGWMPLSAGESDPERAANDTSEGLTHDGQIVLRKVCGPESKEEEIAGHTSYWIRGVLRDSLQPTHGVPERVPVIDDLQARVSFVKAGLLPEAGATDTFALDLSTHFRPFGRQPERYTTFYLASKEVFARRGARVRIAFHLSEAGAPSADLNLTWEYFDGNDWHSIEASEFQDGTEHFKKTGEVTFLNPTDWAETTVAGVANTWLRVRIEAGNYGHPLKLTAKPDPTDPKRTLVEAVESTLAAPVVASVVLQYSYQTAPGPLDHCLAFNDFVFVDHSMTARWPRRSFEPFRAVSEAQPAVHFGFNQPLPSGLVSLFVQVGAEEDLAARPVPAFVWEYRSETGWSELGVLDETSGFRRTGMVQFVGAPDAVATEGLGGKLHRIRARLKGGERLTLARLGGVWMNAVWATHRAVSTREEIGFSDGNPGQVQYFRRERAPILAGETIEVREWVGRGADWEAATLDVPLEDLRLERDPVSGTVREVWVRWHERPHLFGSAPRDRHYVIERALGSLRFGDGTHGRVPNAGNRIVASYASGGGLGGNVPGGVITELRAAVPFLKSVGNPAAAEGGAATELIDAVQARGAQRFRHGDRAIAIADVEWIAREASPEVARARCLAVTGPVGRVQRGWITVVIVPLTSDAQPMPTAVLRRRVHEYLAARVPAALANRIGIVAPSYRAIGVVAEISPVRPEETARVEARVRLRLDQFLHPLTGGERGRGWSFGEPLHASDIARVIEETEGVDYASEISLRAGDTVLSDTVSVLPDVLIATASHELKLKLGET